MRRNAAVVALLAIALVAAPAASVTAAAASAVLTSAAAPLRVTMTELPTLGGEDTRVSGVNDSGQAIGSSQRPDGTVHAVLWENGGITELLPDWAFSSADAINDAGQVLITGQRVTDGPTEHGLITQGTLAVIPDVVQAIRLNARGQVVGTSTAGQGFIWTRGVSTPITAPDGQTFTARDLNDRGAVAGTVSVDGVDGVSPATWKRGKLRVVDIPVADVVPFESVQVNNRGQVLVTNFFGAYLATKRGTTAVGTPSGAPVPSSDGYFLTQRGDVVSSYVIDGGPSQVFEWHRGTFTAVPTLPGADMSVTDVNDCGQIIGSTLARTPDGVVRGGFVWSRGQLVDIGAAVGVSPTVGVELTDLSRKGQIIGSILTITDPGSESIHQTNRPVLWTVH